MIFFLCNMGEFEKAAFNSNKRDSGILPNDSLAYYSRGADKNGEFISYRQGENGNIFYIYKDGKVGVAEQAGNEIVVPSLNTEEGRGIWGAAQLLQERDKQIHTARQSLARQLAEGNQLFEQVLVYAIEKADGNKPEPEEIINGVRMYRVGENANQTFLIGVKDNRLFLFIEQDDVYLLTDSFEEDKTFTSDEILRVVIENIYNAWDETKQSEEFFGKVPVIVADRESNPKIRIYGETDSSQGSQSESEDSYNTEVSEEERFAQFEREEREFLDKNEAKIRATLEPILLNIMAGKIVKEQKIEIKLADGTIIPVYIRKELIDVTDEEKVYIGRGAYFYIKPRGEEANAVQN